jgi:hypothetical protein
MAVGCGGGGDVEPPASTPSDGGVDAPPAAPQTLAIRSVDVYQSVQIPILKDFEHVLTRNAPIVAGRSAVMRVAVKPDVGWKRKKLDATLTITTSAGTVDKKITREVGPAGSYDADYASTLNFELEKELITREATFSLTIDSAGEPLARFPGEDVEPLGAVATGTLKVEIVPVKWDADGSGRVPDTSESALEMYRSALFGMYPVTDVKITVREPFAWTETVTADGTGWDTLLTAIVDLRNTDKAPSDVYYYGLFRPNDTFWKYCERGCVAGLSGLLRDPGDAFGRGSIGLGYGDDSAKTMAHEIGHAHGRAHAPCGGAAGVDKKFPYAGGEIGVYGWEPTEKTLIDTSYSDVMGYCYPVWVSDYTYQALFDRVSYVSKAAKIITASDAPIHWRFVHIGRDGKLSWGRTTTTREVPLAEEHTVTFEAADGTKHSVTGHYYPYADLAGGYLVVPEPAFAPAKLTVAGLGPSIEPVLKFRH